MDEILSNQDEARPADDKSLSPVFATAPPQSPQSSTQPIVDGSTDDQQSGSVAVEGKERAEEENIDEPVTAELHEAVAPRDPEEEKNKEQEAVGNSAAVVDEAPNRTGNDSGKAAPAQPTTEETTPAVAKSRAVERFSMREITLYGQPIHIGMQDTNGPCPLLALVNAMALRGDMELSAMPHSTAATLLNALGIHLTQLQEKLASRAGSSSTADANLEYALNDALAAMPSLLDGLDVDVKFSAVDGFAFTPALCILDVCNIRLLHGWVVDKESFPAEVFNVVGQRSYNQLVDLVVSQPTTNEAAVANEWLSSTASQLTMAGLFGLQQQVRDGEFAILFRNNHFSVITKQYDTLFVLVTDVGYINVPRAVWEVLNDVDDTPFVDTHFGKERIASPKAASARQPSPSDQPGVGGVGSGIGRTVGVRADSDSGMEERAMSSEESDRMLAQQLYNEEVMLARREEAALQQQRQQQQPQQQQQRRGRDEGQHRRQANSSAARAAQQPHRSTRTAASNRTQVPANRSKKSDSSCAIC